MALAGFFLLLRILRALLSHLLGVAAFSSSDANAMWHDRLSAFPISALLLCVCLVPASEEIFFRGFLYAGIAKSHAGPYTAIALTAGLWAVTHQEYEPAQIAELFLLGLFLGWSRKTTSSLVPPIAIHALYNFFTLLPLVLNH